MKLAQSKDEATLLAKALKAKMKTRGWRIYVWNNLGWHHAIKSPWITVCPSYGGYSAYLNSDGNYSCGDACSFWNGRCGETVTTHSDPNVAVARRIASAEAHANQLVNKLAQVKQILSRKREV